MATVEETPAQEVKKEEEEEMPGLEGQGKSLAHQFTQRLTFYSHIRWSQTQQRWEEVPQGSH